MIEHSGVSKVLMAMFGPSILISNSGRANESCSQARVGMANKIMKWWLPCIFFLGFCVQFGFIVRDALYPSKLITVVHTVPFNSETNPLAMKFCVQPAFNTTRLQIAGYDDVGSYLSGVSRYNNSIRGWTGHTEVGGTFGTVSEVWNTVANIKNISDLVKLITYDDVWYDVSNIVESTVTTILSDSGVVCFSPYIEQQFGSTKITVVMKQSLKVSIWIEDKGLVTRRPIMANKLRYMGDDIIIENNIWSDYIIEVQKNVYENEDNCKTYPNAKYQTYDDCDHDQTKEKLFTRFGNDVPVPIWATYDHNEVFNKTFHVTKPTQTEGMDEFSQWSMSTNDWLSVWYSDYNAGKMSPCPLPCDTSKTTTKQLVRQNSSSQFFITGLTIEFLDRMHETRTGPLTTTFVGFLSSVGGSLGLWLGLGGLQLAELLVTTGSKIWRITRALWFNIGVLGNTIWVITETNQLLLSESGWVLYSLPEPK
jgi:hypothetical protein